MQEINIDKPLSLLGPNATYNPNSNTTPANAQAIIETGTSDPNINDATAVSIIGVKRAQRNDQRLHH